MLREKVSSDREGERRWKKQKLGCILLHRVRRADIKGGMAGGMMWSEVARNPW